MPCPAPDRTISLENIHGLLQPNSGRHSRVSHLGNYHSGHKYWTQQVCKHSLSPVFLGVARRDVPPQQTEGNHIRRSCENTQHGQCPSRPQWCVRAACPVSCRVDRKIWHRCETAAHRWPAGTKDTFQFSMEYSAQGVSMGNSLHPSNNLIRTRNWKIFYGISEAMQVLYPDVSKVSSTFRKSHAYSQNSLRQCSARWFCHWPRVTHPELGRTMKNYRSLNHIWLWVGFCWFLRPTSNLSTRYLLITRL